MVRPYLQSGIVELEALYEASRDKPQVLTNLRAELKQRKTERSERLRAKVEHAIAAMGQGRSKLLVTATAPAGNTSGKHVQVELSLESPHGVGFPQVPGDMWTGTTNGVARPRSPQGIGQRTMPTSGEHDHLKRSYERLRERLLDMSLKNPMLSYKHRPTSKRQLQVIDEVPEAIFELLVEGSSLELVALPDPDNIPHDEKTDEFVAALSYAKSTETEYLEALKIIEEQAAEDVEAQLAKAERALRDRLRVQFGLSPLERAKPIDPVQYARELGMDPSFDLQAQATADRHRDKRLQTLKFAKPLDAILEKVRGDARLAEQETGLSTLFLVFGFLEWCEQDDGNKLLAPLLLLPVHLDQKRSPKGRTIYEVTATTTAAEDNLSLRKRIQRDFAVTLPEPETDVENSMSVEAYFKKVGEAVAHLKGWRVRRLVTLGHFMFGRFAMYADLDPERWATHPAETDLVGSVMRGTEAGQGEGSPFGEREDHAIDDPHVEAKAPFLIHDADASQHSALVDAMDGKQLVIQGPPGTGKSQTITNLIANALAAGKTVLFLAEKQAALEVVKRRLDNAGLGEFCLELHSDKASPKATIEHLKERIAIGVRRQAPARVPADVTLVNARQEVSQYVSALNGETPDGKTPFGLMWKALKSRSDIGEALDAFGGIQIPQADAERLHEITQARTDVGLYAEIASSFVTAFGSPESSAWAALTFGPEVTPGTAGLLIDELRGLRDRARAVEDFLGSVADLGLGDVAGIRTMASALRQLAELGPDPVLLAQLRGHDPETVKAHLGEVESALDLGRLALANPIPDGFDDAVLDAVEALAAAAGQERRSPSEIIADAERTREEAAALVPAFAAAEPLVQALGLRADLPCDGLRGAMVAAYAVAKVPNELRPWFVWSPVGDFAAALGEWRTLTSEEAKWRGRFTGARSEWPTQAELRDVANLLRKGWLARTFAPTQGKQAVTAMASRLGMPELAPAQADTLEALGVHAEAVHAFSVSDRNTTMWGTRWAGLRTPFEAAAKAQDIRVITMRHVSECACGAEVVERLGILDEAAIGRLAVLAPDLSPLRRLPDEILLAAGPSYDQARRDLPARQARAGRILDADPEGLLWDQAAPLDRLVDAVGIERRLRAAWQRLGESLLTVARDTGTLEEARAAWHWLGTVEGATALQPVREALLGPDIHVMHSRLREAASKGMALADRLEEGHGDLRQRFGLGGLETDRPGDMRERLDGLVDRQDELSALVDLRRQRLELERLGLLPFITRAAERQLPVEMLPRLFEGILARRRAETFRQRDPVLSRAVGSRIQAQRKTFVDADRRKIERDRKTVRENLLANGVPAGSAIGKRATWTEGALLANETNKQKRFTPVRDLMRRASLSLQRLTPCFMMSPLSLAKFLPGGQVRFDLLVIDEASQMRPEDALGGLLRARQIVVVGDQKQLPPSEFFNRSGGGDTSDDEEIDDIDDESILESCAKTFRETRLLKWHYRSRCESLIAFSNREFYGDNLITFPSAAPRSFSIDLIRVKGRYEASRNPIEAQSVAEEAILFMRHHASEPAPSSVGVVAVNSEQRDLIDEEIQRLSAEDDLVQLYQERVAERGEPFFVKNLENVQGDERDFIFVSMTYGPKEPGGTVLQRFGPINGKHGHRRLNVLFTRARLRIALFASFGSVDVKPSDTSPEGLRVLKRYFEYAERRGYAEVDPQAQADSDFEVEVARRLQAKGFQVDHQVGVSGFRIDLGIRHPDHPERFVAGVECDGARYHSSKSARDRDRLREEVLTGLGWNILRVWSTDWFDNPDLQTRNLVSRLRELQSVPVPEYQGYRLAAGLPLDPEPEVVSAIEAKSEGEPPAPQPIADEQASFASPSPLEAEAPTAASLLDDDGPLTLAQLCTALREFRDTVIARQTPTWEPHRSILRENMIEMFVLQELDDPDDWFRKVPGFQRSGTDPVEKRLYLEPICDLVARMTEGGANRAGATFPKQTGVLPTTYGHGTSSTHPVLDTPRQTAARSPSLGSAGPYVVADLAACGVSLDPSRFYEPGYRDALGKMVGYVVGIEGPIYADVLVTRIARAHGFERNGGRIVKTVMDAISPRCARTRDDGGEIVWQADAQDMVRFRRALGQERALDEIPVVELASIAAPLVARGMKEEDILIRMRDDFQLGKLRDATRRRFEAAIETCRKHRLHAAE